MKTPHRLAILLAAVTAIAAVPAVAHPHDPVFHAREARQAGRIDAGVASGALTPRELVRLASEQRALRREEHVFRSDGVLTPRERAVLARGQNAASRDIYRQKHDGERAF